MNKRRGLVSFITRTQPVRQHVHSMTLKPRGQLSGRIARTTRGKEINELRVTVLNISPNMTTGQRGPWFHTSLKEK